MNHDHNTCIINLTRYIEKKVVIMADFIMPET